MTRGASSRVGGGRSTFALPLLEDRSSIQLAIGQVLQQIASNDLDPRRAGLLLYGLQIASLNLPKPNSKEQSESTTVSEITHDAVLGDLAPAAELGHDQPISSAQRLLDELDRIDSIHAVADPKHQPQTKPDSPSLNTRTVFLLPDEIAPVRNPARECATMCAFSNPPSHSAPHRRQNPRNMHA